MLLRRIKGFVGWVLHRMVLNYWSLALAAVLIAFPVAYALLLADKEGATDWLLSRDWAPTIVAATAKDFLAMAAGVNAAFITLYFSITLIVLSLAASSLGIRLIDRWLESFFIRISIAGLSFTLVVTMVAMLRVDDTAPVTEVPQLTVLAVLALQALNLGMLSVSLHHLGRTMFVDRSVSALAADAGSQATPLTGAALSTGDEREAPRHVVTAQREGYVESLDLDDLQHLLRNGPDGRIRVLAGPGQHVLKGQPIYRCDTELDERRLLRAMPIGDCRSDTQGEVFQVRLLVEIAARALSPAVNDFYTALTCADKLTHVMGRQIPCWVDDEDLPVLAADPRIELPGQDFRGLFENPLNAFRQAACQYPSIAIRMIGNYARLATLLQRQGGSEQLRAYLRRLATEMRDHARSVAQYEEDRADIDTALERFDAINA